MALTKILDKLVQIGPGYLDQTLRTYVAENRHYRFYTDTANNKSYAVAAFFTSGELVLNESKKTDILIVAGGGGSSIGNLSGGSGAGKVVNIEDAMLPANHFLASVGAGGAGGTLTSGWQTNIPSAEGIGSIGNDSSFGLYSGANTIIANGGGVGGFRQVDTLGLDGGSGGGAGGADLDASGVLVGSPPNFEVGRANTTDPTVTTALSSKYYSGNVFSYGNDGGRKEKKLYQSCHILHKQGRYFIVHFKELFALDGKYANITLNDVQRRNRIVKLLSDWGLITVENEESICDIAPLNQIKVISYKEKSEWTLETKYNIGKKRPVEPESDK